MASSSAACVFGGVRLISSANRMFVKTGPLENAKCRFPCSSSFNRVVPVISVGIRSGVNCTRVKSSDMVSDRQLIIRVLARPGTPSMTQWPLAKNAVSTSLITSTWPTMILATSALIASPAFLRVASSSAWLGASWLVLCVVSILLTSLLFIVH